MGKRGWIEMVCDLLDVIRGNNVNQVKTEILHQVGMSPNKFYDLLEHLAEKKLIFILRKGKKKGIPKITERGKRWLIKMELLLEELDYESIKAKRQKW